MNTKKWNPIRFFVLLLLWCLFGSTVLYAYPATYTVPKASAFNPTKAVEDIEGIVNQKAVVSANVADGVVTVDAEAVVQKFREAYREAESYKEALHQKNLSLNREPVITVTVQATQADSTNGVEIFIDRTSLHALQEVQSFKFVLQNKKEEVLIKSENILAIEKEYGVCRVQIKKINHTYHITFLDQFDHVLPHYITDIGFAFPAEHSEQTVHVFKDNAQENWGGQFDPVRKTMHILTAYTGEYTVATPEIDIHDIAELSEYEQQAIRFMVIRGYFSLKNGNFKPDETLTRYNFAESLVRMYFALDAGATCTFSDVAKSQYQYVAASEERGIVEGFDDGTFRGKEKVTAEQVIALAARTIHTENGYVYPESLESYLNFPQDNPISDWAQKEVALAMREGIYDSSMPLVFQAPISRKDAAVILYRLFMILNNTPDPYEFVDQIVEMTSVRTTFWSRTNMWITIGVVLLIDTIVLIICTRKIKKRKGRHEASESKSL